MLKFTHYELSLSKSGQRKDIGDTSNSQSFVALLFRNDCEKMLKFAHYELSLSKSTYMIVTSEGGFFLMHIVR